MNIELEREALLAIDQLEARVRQIEHERTEAIAIVGFSGRFPGCQDAAAFWELLSRGDDVFGEPFVEGSVPKSGLIDKLDWFDSGFFHISPREAVRMDPRQRLLLETAWKALENAGMPPANLEKPEVGVYVGVSGNGHAPVLLDHQTDTYNVTGTVSGISSGRISFFGVNNDARARRADSSRRRIHSMSLSGRPTTSVIMISARHPSIT